MKPYELWKSMMDAEMSPEQYQMFWKDYFAQETEFYRQLLQGETKIVGTIASLSGQFGVEEPVFSGFLDGINTSLKTDLDLESLESDTEITLDVDLEKLYFNMHDAKAKWLYTLKEWDTLLSQETRREIKKSYRDSVIVVKSEKIGRNDPCPCGSGKKYKKCCMDKEEA